MEKRNVMNLEITLYHDDGDIGFIVGNHTDKAFKEMGKCDPMIISELLKCVNTSIIYKFIK